MYRLISIYANSKDPKSHWGEIDFSQLTGVDLYKKYKNAYLTLESDLLDKPVTIDASVYYSVLSTQNALLSDIFLNWQDNTSLKTTQKPTYTTKRALFTDAFRAGYMVHKAKPGAHKTAQADDRQKTEMQISRPSTDMRLFEKFCLITCNGFFYRCQADEDKAYVQEAGKTLLKNKYNHVGILSFQQIGSIKTYPVEKNVLPIDDAIEKKIGVNIALPQEDLENKSILLVHMGYIHLVNDGSIHLVSDTRAHFHLNQINLVERYKESTGSIDWSSVITNPNSVYVDGSELLSDESIDKTFSHPQTFWVVVDTPNLRWIKEPVRSLPLPGQYIHYEEPVSLMCTGEGRVLEYWKTYYDREWALFTSGVRPGRSISSTVGRGVWGGNFSLRNTAYNIKHNQDAWFMDILSDIKSK